MWSRRGWFLWACICVLPILTAIAGGTANYRAGVARVEITPPVPYWMSGYAARTHPSEGTLQPLWAKALSLRDSRGNRVVFVTTDLIGIPKEVSGEVFARARKQYKLERNEIVLNCSHTHCGPAVGSNLNVMFEWSEEEKAQVDRYTADLIARLTTVIGEALGQEKQGELACGQGAASFAINRRANRAGKVSIGLNPEGPVDHSVPVVRVKSADGKLLVALFGYSCHNTTLGGDFYQVNGDYAGHAQAHFEATHPGATAMFMILCGGDQNPNPRGTPELAKSHGERLAEEVGRVIGSDLRPVSGPIRTSSEMVSLTFAPHTRTTFEQELEKGDKFRQRRARLMLAAYDRGRPVVNVDYPVQAVRLGNQITFVTLGGEVVVDYGLRTKREFANENLVVAGYCNDVMCYIPSKRVLKEGGYEAVESMIYYGQPGPFSEKVEDQVFSGIYKALRRVGIKPSAP